MLTSTLSMNHVAHCLLSYPDEELLIGNFIGDYVKGSAWKQYPERIQMGIHLHRFIDVCSEDHPALRRSIQRIRPFGGRFSAPILDILCDYLLCNLWEKNSILPDFDHFANWAYCGLNTHRAWMPEKLRQRWPDMLAGRFLHLYRSVEGLTWTLERFAKRLPFPLDVACLMDALRENRADFEADLQEFFPHLLREVVVWRRHNKDSSLHHYEPFRRF